VRDFLEERVAALQKQIEATTLRQAEISTAIERDGVTLPGSRGQIRPHPLLTIEQSLRQEKARALRELEAVLLRLEREQELERMNAITSWARAPEAG
jgi:hypothetical protein